MKKLLLITIAPLLVVTACTYEQSADEMAAAQTEQITKSIEAAVGMPRIVNYNEIKLVNRVYELRDQANLPTYAYMTDMNGNLHCLGKSIGYGIPYATQRSNPEKLEYRTSYIQMPQAEPNGLFMPASAEATWIILIDSEGKQQVSYVEEKLIVLPFKSPLAKTQC